MMHVLRCGQVERIILKGAQLSSIETKWTVNWIVWESIFISNRGRHDTVIISRPFDAICWTRM